jgi:hypothetical protein
MAREESLHSASVKTSNIIYKNYAVVCLYIIMLDYVERK